MGRLDYYLPPQNLLKQIRGNKKIFLSNEVLTLMNDGMQFFIMSRNLSFKNIYRKKNTTLELEYFTIAEEKTLKSEKSKGSDKKYRAFIAVFAGEIRLIDNLQLKNN